MSTISSDDHLGPHNPLYYAPRRLREKSQRSSPSSTEAPSERLKRLVSAPPAYDASLEDAVAAALRHPLDPEVVQEPEGFANERDQRKGWLRVAVRSVAAIGVAAVVALFVVMMVPMAQDHAGQPDGSALSMPGIVASAKAALNPARHRADDATPDVSEFQTILASSRTEQPVVTHEQSETLLQQFLQWQKKPAETH